MIQVPRKPLSSRRIKIILFLHKIKILNGKLRCFACNISISFDELIEHEKKVHGAIWGVEFCVKCHNHVYEKNTGLCFAHYWGMKP